MDPSLEIEHARRALEGVLAVLATEGASEQRIRGAMERCARSFERLAPELESPELESDEHRRVVAAELAELGRLNALVASCAKGKRDEVRALLRCVREEQKSLTFYTPDGETGVSCDLSV